MKLALALPLIGLLWLCPCAPAADLNVPADYPTIQAALTAAAPGDTIILAPGTYQGAGNRNLILDGAKNLTLRGTDPDDPAIVKQTVIDGENLERCISSCLNSTIAGLTIKNGNATQGGGIFCQGSVVIRNCRFEANTATDKGGGIFCQNPGAQIQDCQIYGNSAYNGGGMAFYSGSNPLVQNCIIHNNYASYSGGGVYSEQSNGIITSTQINNNQATNDGGVMLNKSSPEISFCDFSANQDSFGYGALYIFGGNPFIHHCRFINNHGTAIYRKLGSPDLMMEIQNCFFIRNIGPALCDENTNKTNLTNCVICNNDATDWIGAAGGINGAAIVKNCILWGNVSNTSNQQLNVATEVRYTVVQGGRTGATVGELPHFFVPVVVRGFSTLTLLS